MASPRYCFVRKDVRVDLEKIGGFLVLGLFQKIVPALEVEVGLSVN